ncbi:hypothetical protein OROHE_004724 [Orobanche hederae]
MRLSLLLHLLLLIFFHSSLFFFSHVSSLLLSISPLLPQTRAPRCLYSPIHPSAVAIILFLSCSLRSCFVWVRFTVARLLGDDYLASIDDYLARNCPEPLALIHETLQLCGNRHVLFDNCTDDGAHQLKKRLCLVDTVVDANDDVPYTIELIIDYPDLSGNGSNKVYDEEQMSGFLEKIESRLRESALMLENRLAEKCIARMQAEAKALEAQTKLLHEMSGLRFCRQSILYWNVNSLPGINSLPLKNENFATKLFDKVHSDPSVSFFGWPDFCLFKQSGSRLFLSSLLRLQFSLAGLLVQAIRIRFCRCELKKMEIEQELEWKAAQSTKISVDLVTAAKQQLKFLAAIDRSRWLYEGPGLDRAIYRYNVFWLPLLANHSESRLLEGPLVVPLNCEWIWHCHRLNPVRYKSDCDEFHGKILDNQNVVSSVGETSRSPTEDIWKNLYPGEPYELDFTSVLHDNIQAEEERSEKCTTVSRPYMDDDGYLEGSIARYKAFLHLIKRNREKSIKGFSVPPYDIDLIWHTHELHPVSYGMDLLQIMGKISDHDDTDSDRTKGQKLEVGFSGTTKTFEDMHGFRYWRFC